jgi:hypothetical protein
MREEDSVGSPYRNHHLGTIADILRRIIGRSFVQIVLPPCLTKSSLLDPNVLLVSRARAAAARALGEMFDAGTRFFDDDVRMLLSCVNNCVELALRFFVGGLRDLRAIDD